MQFHVGCPAVRGGLTVFPVFNGNAVAARGYDLWDGLLRAVAIDAVGAPAVETPGRRARRFVRRVAECGTPGESPFARVSGLRWRGRGVQTVAVNVRHELVAA